MDMKTVLSDSSESDLNVADCKEHKEYVLELSIKASETKKELISLSTESKNLALEKMSKMIAHERSWILKENQKDLIVGEEKGLSKALLDRLHLTDSRIESMCQSLREIAALPDPVFSVENQKRRPNGLLVGKMRMPLGVILVIYESRPNVTTEVSSLCFKSGNVSILKGGSESFYSNQALVQIIQQSLKEEGISPSVVHFIESTDRKVVLELLKMNHYIDIVVPRGGESLIQMVVENSNIPVVKHDKGVCNLYVHQDADRDMVNSVVLNAKTQRPGTCNALENLIFHQEYPYKEELIEILFQNQVELRGCEQTQKLDSRVVPALEEDYFTEYLDMILAVRIVSSYESAVKFIERYGSHHTDGILTESYRLSQSFLMEVDSAVVSVNASTRFTDGQELGLGAEIGISTNKLHARGPMGLEDLTTQKFVILGQGQIR